MSDRNSRPIPERQASEACNELCTTLSQIANYAYLSRDHFDGPFLDWFGGEYDFGQMELYVERARFQLKLLRSAVALMREPRSKPEATD